MKHLKSYKPFCWQASLVILPLALCSNLTQAESERALTDYDSSQYDNISYPGIELPPASERTSTIDERSLWRLLSNKKYDQLNKMIKRFEDTYPNWQAPSDLIAAKVHGEIKQAITLKNYELILQLEKDNSELFGCSNIDHMWAVGDALEATDQTSKLFTHYQKLITQCTNSEHRLITLQRGSSQLPYQSTRELLDLEASKPHSSFEQKALDQCHYDFFSGWFTNAWDRKQFSEAEVPAKYLQAPIVERKDASMASLLGWYEYQRKQPALARNWFTRALEWEPNSDTAYGLALTLRDVQQSKESKKVIDQWQDKEPRMTTLFTAPSVKIKRFVPRRSASEIALERAIRKYNRNDYEGSLATTQSALRKISSSNTNKTTRSLRTFEAWSFFNLSQTRIAAERFSALYQQQAEIDSARGLLLSSIANKEYEKVRALGAADCGPLSFLSATRIPSKQPTVRSEISDLYYLFYKNWIGDELVKNDYRSVELKILRIADRIIDLEDGEMAVAAGWAYLNKGDLGSALFWFERALAWSPSANSAYGLALVKQALGKHREAELLTEKWKDKSSDLTALHGDLLLHRATAEYANKNFPESLSLAEESSQFKPSLEADKLIAWSKYQLGEKEIAAEKFEELYREQPDQQSADGLSTTLRELDRESYLEEIAKESDGPLADNIANRQAEKYYYQDKFVLAEKTRSTVLPMLKNVNTAAASLTPYARHRSGESGLGQLDLWGAKLAGRAFINQHHFDVSLDFINLDSGAPAQNAQLGSNANRLSNTFSTTPTDKESSLIEPTFGYRYAADISPYVSIGTTPLGGEVSGTLTGELGVDWKQGENDQNEYRLKLFRKNKQESILSTTGIVDPVAGTKWGRVVETGAQLDARFQILDNWTLSSGAVLGKLDGHNVADNEHYGLWASLGYNFEKEGFKYLTLGPAYRFEHFNENRRFFTFGHGGYFSPDAFHKLGGEINFQTDEGKQFIIKGRASLGYQSTSENNAFAFPLSGTGPVLNGDESDGIAFDSQLSAVYRVNPWIQVGAFLNMTQSPDFDDIGGGLMIRINAFDRPAVFSMDLPVQPWND